jgi:hypothetical protein
MALISIYFPAQYTLFQGEEQATGGKGIFRLKKTF